MTSSRPVIPDLLPCVDRAQIRYVQPTARLQRMLVRVRADGSVYVRGQRDEIEELIERLRRAGLTITIDFLSFCG